ncbi:nitroreductase [Nocardia sp. GAS34]|uniref:Acg family FMN-binding oxidoreductase n=1 Tax=unclassified Nocardia TaxID=2637762 RepID=UPI003D23E4D2
MSTIHPDIGTVRAALELAIRAPSVHNTQPWLWRVGDSTVHLYADTTRWLSHTDPDQRDLLISCGAALHHLRVAARALGWETTVHRLPNPADPEHLAAVEFRAATPDTQGPGLARAITRRRTDGRRFTSCEVHPTHLDKLTAVGRAYGVQVHDIEHGGERTELLRAFEWAAREHAADFGYGVELSQWSGRHAAPTEVSARSAVASMDDTVRPFSNPGLPEAVVRDIDVAERMLVLSTSGDDRISRLRTGEAMSAVLLTATQMGLATCALSEPLEVADTRAAIRTDVLGDSGFPQMIIRLGWAATSADPVPATPRRPLEEVVKP